MNTRIHMKLGKTTSLRVLVWMLAILMVAPPPLLAQMVAPSLGGASSMTQTPSASSTTQPMMTNPSAMKPLEFHQTPCPVPLQEQEIFPPSPPWPQVSPPAGITQVQAGGIGQQPLQAQPGMPPSPMGAPLLQQQGMGGQIFPQQQGGFGGAFSPFGAGMMVGPLGSSAGLQAGPQGLPSGSMMQPGVGGLMPSSGMMMIPSGPVGPGMAPPGMQLERPGATTQLPGDPLSQISAGLLSQAESEAIGQLPIEQSFARSLQLQGMSGKLKQFGYNFFELQSAVPLPGMDVPVGPDYVLGPDDTLALNIWNVPDANLNRSYIASVERDGSIFIPQVGPIPVVGTTFSQATRLIQARLSNFLKRFELHVSVARLRSIKIFVVGEVIRPGAYEVSSLATVSQALYAACGPAKSGSLRAIRLVRSGQTIQELDFYQFLLRGDRTQDLRLQSGDTVLVPPIGPIAAIGGPVKRPAIYELKDRATLTSVIELAGGLTATAGRRKCQIFRTEAGKQRVIVDVDLAGLLDGKTSVKEDSRSGKAPVEVDPQIQDGDFVRIASVPSQVENAVSLIGAIRDAGQYEFRPGMRLRDLLTPEQMLTDSFWDRAELIRTDPVSYETTVIQFSPKELFKVDGSANIELRRLDRVVVATQVKPPRLVMVQGEVKRPGTYTIESGERLSSVLKRSGGMTLRAFPQGIFLIRLSVRRTQQTEIEKFIANQKQKLIADAAAYSAGGSGFGEQATLQVQLMALDQLAARIQPGRVIVKMESLEQLEGSSEDIPLEEGDLITIPQRPQTVTIVGAVRSPTSVVHQEGLGMEDYLRLAGGMTADAAKKEMYILRANGSVEAAYAKFKVIGPGDTIVVPQGVDPKLRPLPFWSSVIGIMSGMVSAVTAALAILVIGRQ